MTQIVSADSIGTDVQFIVGSFASLLIPQGFTVGSTGANAINASGSFIKLMINGTVFASGDGIDLGDQINSGDEVTIGRFGSVTGGNTGGIVLYNAGSHLVNFGQVSGTFTGVYVAANVGPAVNLFNAGDISGNVDGIYDSFSSALVLTNTGSIFGGSRGSFTSSDSGTSEETIHNRGTMVGDILLSLGDDTYDGRGGSVEGAVYGGGDHDTFIAGLSEESFDGGDGIDLLDFTRSAGLTVSLDGTVEGTRGAAGDTYVNIENVTGSRFGNDRLYGDSGANVLSGLGGVDLLSGGLGKDTLIGGVGKDVLTGGAGNDAFVFNSLAEVGDKITDFSAAAGNNDILWIKAAAFGGGMSAGALNHIEFQSSVDNVALDANIRFIFKTADTTLWFDANGSAAGGLTLVADLQANAVFGFADILLT